MAIDTDIAIDVSGNIYYTGAVHGAAGAGYYTVIELHRYLQDLADDAVAAGDDLIDITSITPSDRSTDNIITVRPGYRLDNVNGSATDAIDEHLYDGSIIQEDDGSIWDGAVVIAAEGMDLQILQNGALVTNDFWNSVPNGETLKGLNRDAANGISHRFMLKVNNAGTPIDGRRIVGMTRELGKTFSEFRVNGTARGNNVLALTYADDLNNATAPATIATWTTITNVEGYREIDIDGNGTPEPYYSEWNRASFSVNQFYERMKWLSAAESGTSATTANATIYGLDANIFRGITHEIPLDSGSQSVTDFSAVEAVSWTGGTGQMLAIDDINAGTRMWIQLLTGLAPGSGVTITGVTSTATALTNGLASEQTISAPFAGVSTGSALIGAYGFAIEAADTSASDLFTDLDGNTNQPPNNVTFTVNGLVSAEDRVLVGPEDGASGLRTGQGVLDAGITGASTTIVVNSGTETLGTGQPSGTDTPTAGTIRVLGDDGVYARVTYTGRTFGVGSISFTGCAGAPVAALGNDVFISYIDKLAGAAGESYTVVYSNTPRSLFIRVRDGGTAGDLEGIKTFETTGTLGAAGGSTTVIRTTDV